MSIKPWVLGGATLLALTACKPEEGGNNNGNEPADTAPPTIVSLSSQDKVLLGSEPITIEFSEPVDIATLSLGLGRLSSAEITTTPNSDNSALTLTPDDDWPGGTFTLSVAVDDLAGNAMAAQTFETTVNFNFTQLQAAELEIGSVPIKNEETGESELDSFFSFATSPLVHEGELWVADANNGLFKFNQVPTQSHTNFDEKIESIELIDDQGQVIFEPIDSAISPFVADGRMILTNPRSNKIFVFNGIPQAGQNNPGIVLGQTEVTGTEGSCAAVGLNQPTMATVVDKKLIATDSINNRVLIWNTLPTESGTAPDMVLGQNSFTSCDPNDDNQDKKIDNQATARTLATPVGFWSDGEKLLVADTRNNRVLIWNSFPTENFSQADLVLGQPDFSSSEANNDIDDQGRSVPSARTLNRPRLDIVSNGRQIILTDTQNNRVMIWNEWPTENFQPADNVLGQSDFAHTTENDEDQDNAEGDPTLKTLSFPVGVFANNNDLFVADANNNRILLFKAK